MNISKIILFLLSPFLSMPLILHGIYKRDKNSLLLFIFILALISYLYIPSISADKAYYYYLYENFNFTDFTEFYRNFLIDKTDIIFYFLIFVFKLMGFSLNILFFLITSLTLWLWFIPVYKIITRYHSNSNTPFFIFFLLVLFSFSPAGIFSGIRFYFAISLVFYSFSNAFLFNATKVKPLILIILASLTHFSCSLFIPVFLLLSFKPNSQKLYLYLFLFSFIFILLPRDFLLSQFSKLSLTDVFETKASSYLGDSDYIENSISVGNFNNFLKYFFKTLWVYLAYLYLFLKRKPSLMWNSLLLVLALSNIFYSAPTVYNRYIILALGLFIILIIKDHLSGIKNKLYIYSLLLILGLNFFGNIYAMKDSFINSLKNIDSLSLITILLKDDVEHKKLK